MDEPEKLLRTCQLAELLEISPKTVTRWANENGLPVAAKTALGGHRRYRWSDVEVWVKEMETRKEANHEVLRQKAHETHGFRNDPQPDSSTSSTPVPVGGPNGAGRVAP